MTGKEDPTEDSCAGTPADKDNKAAAGNVGELVEMPEDYLRWLLAQTRETDPVSSLAMDLGFYYRYAANFFIRFSIPYSNSVKPRNTISLRFKD
jgi:hypothetical protein